MDQYCGKRIWSTGSFWGKAGAQRRDLTFSSANAVSRRRKTRLLHLGALHSCYNASCNSNSRQQGRCHTGAVIAFIHMVSSQQQFDVTVLCNQTSYCIYNNNMHSVHQTSFNHMFTWWHILCFYRVWSTRSWLAWHPLVLASFRQCRSFHVSSFSSQPSWVSQPPQYQQ